MTALDLAFMTVEELGVLLRTGETSPVELTRLSLERLDSIGRDLNAVVTITADIAEAQATIAEAELRAGIDRGPLHGIPYGAKDILSTANIPTTWGAAPYRDQVFDYDATVVGKLRDRGAILVAKLATIELAGGMTYEGPGASLTGPTANPWNRQAWSGGSSSGPAAAVAAGLVPFAIGSDTGGSITFPAAYSGVAGLRGTYGLVSLHGAMAIAWTLDRLGPLARTAVDCGLVLEAIAGFDPQDPSTVNRPYRFSGRNPRTHGFRFGMIEGSVEAAEPEVRANFAASLDVLAQVGTIEPVQMPDFPYDDVFWTILAAESYSAFEDFMRAGQSLLLASPRGRMRLAAEVLPAHVYLRAQRIRREIVVALRNITRRFDALLAPTSSTVATSLTGPDRERSGTPPPTNLPGNLAGLPSITVPNGFGAGSLPTAIQFMGNAFADNAVLDSARAFQSMTQYHKEYPSR